jgi:putative heme-binding domain-containing protein
MEGKGNQDITWRSRTGKAIPHLAALASNPSEPLENRLRYFRAFDFNPDNQGKSEALVKMLEGKPIQQENADDEQRKINRLVLTHLEPSYLGKSASARAALRTVLDETAGSDEYLEMVQRFGVKEENPRLLTMAMEESDNNKGRTAATLLLNQGGGGLIREVLYGGEEQAVYDMLSSLQSIGTKESLQLLETLAFDEKVPLNVRREATAAIGGSYGGEERILELLRNDRLQENLIASAVTGVSRAWRKSVRTEAASYLSSSNDVENPLPPMNELLAMKGNAENGQLVFKNNCAICHQVGDMGMDFGPKLTEIGSKLSREAQFISIIHPDAGISFGYEGYMIEMKDGSTLGGIIASQTETDIDLKMPGGNSMAIKTSDIATMQQMENSMMPAGLERAMSTQELVDLVEYLMSLKRKS